MSDTNNVVSIFQYQTNMVSISKLEHGDIAIIPSTGEYVIVGINHDQWDASTEVNFIISSDKNQGRFALLSSFISLDIHLTISAPSETLVEAFLKPQAFLLRKNSIDSSYEMVEPCTEPETGYLTFYPLGRLQVND